MKKNDEFQSHLIYEFGNFRLDASRRLLFAKDAKDPLTVTPKVIAALLLFVEHNGELLTKDQLMADLWPGRVVEENNLTQVISVLRHVLGEQPGENRYLATVPGSGYRFIADVLRGPSSRTQQVTTQEIAVPVSTETSRPRRAALVALTTGLAVALLVYGWYSHWRPTGDTVVSADASPSESVALPSRTVAVLPFENLSADDNNAYVAVGMAESVLHRLASIRNLTVIARTSSFAFRDKTVDARDIGRTLNARYLLEGSLQHSDERLRVTAQLIDASTGAHVWSLRFDRTIDDIFAVEDDIAQAVAHASASSASMSLSTSTQKSGRRRTSRSCRGGIWSPATRSQMPNARSNVSRVRSRLRPILPWPTSRWRMPQTSPLLACTNSGADATVRVA